MKRLAWNDIPKDVIKKLKTKWKNMYDSGWDEKVHQRPCEMCDYLRNRYKDEIFEDKVCDICPGVIDNWCGAGILDSRTSLYFQREHKNIKDKSKALKEWKKEVKELLKLFDSLL